MSSDDQLNEHEIELVNDEPDVPLATRNARPLGMIPIPPLVIDNLTRIISALSGGAANKLLELLKVDTPTLRDNDKNELNKMKEEFGLGLCTQVLIANRTRWAIELVDFTNFAGVVWKYPVPAVIEQKQVGVFLHVLQNFRFTGSSGGLSYSFIGPSGPALRLDVVWSNPSIGHNWVHVRLVPLSEPLKWRTFRSESSTSDRRVFATASNDLVMVTACIGQSTSSFLEINLRERNSTSATDKN